MLSVSISSFAHFGSKGPFGGTVTCSITAADTVYIGTAEGGVYESTSTALVGWRPRPVGLKSGKITALAHTGKFLYAATADSGIFVFNGYDPGSSSNRYWNKVNTGLTDLHVTSLLAISTTTLLAGTSSGIFITTNGGALWTAANGSLHHLHVTQFAKIQNKIFIAAEDGGVYVFDDTGTDWVDFNDTHTDHVNGTNALSANASTDELMVLNENGLFLTTSVSTTAAPVYTSVFANLPSDIIIQTIYNDGTSWYLSTDQGIFVSATGTISWSALNTGLPAVQVNTVISFKGGLVCGTVNKGIYKASLPFTAWTIMNVGFNNLKTTAMHTSGAGFVVAATENGIYVSNDIAANYEVSNNGLIDSLHVNDLIMGESFLFAATQNGGVYVTPDSGKHWSAVTTGLATLNIKKLFYADNTLYAIDANNQIYRSSLASISWSPMQTGLPVNAKPTAMAFYGNNILLGTLGQGIFIRTTTGSSWNSYNSGLSDWNVTSVTVMENKIYAGTDGSGVFISDSAKAAIHWSATAPTSIWHTTTMHLNSSKIQAMAAYGGYVWTSCAGALLASSDEGATWIEGGTQFNLPSFTDVVKINFVTTRVFVSTENNGLYSNGLSELPPVVTGLRNSSVNTDALEIYPNPTAGSFTLNTSNIKGQIAQVTIFDHSGNVKNRFNGLQELYTVDYTQGLYVVQVNTTAGAVYTQKMIIQ